MSHGPAEAGHYAWPQLFRGRGDFGPPIAEELQRILTGSVDAVWETDTAVSNFMLEHPNEYEVAYALPRDDNYGVYYGKGKTDLGDALQAAIDALNEDGTLASIAQTYAMDPAILEVVE